MPVGYSTNPIENFIFVCTRKYFDVVSRKLFFLKVDVLPVRLFSPLQICKQWSIVYMAF